MNLIPDTGQVSTSLCSEELPVQIQALTQVQNAIDELLDLSVKGLLVSSNPVIYADYLSRIGPGLIEPLRKSITSLAPGECRFFLAALLLFFSDHTYAQEVLDEFKKRGPNELVAANKLARAGIQETANLILVRLEELPDQFYDEPTNSGYVQSLLDCLRMLKVDLPEPLWHRIRSAAVSRYIIVS